MQPPPPPPRRQVRFNSGYLRYATPRRATESATALSECAQLLEKSVGLLPPSLPHSRRRRRRAKKSPRSRSSFPYVTNIRIQTKQR